MFDSSRESIRRTRMSRFKFRHAQLMLSIMALVALVVVSGASWKF
jgi:hypothetical protein